MSIASAVISKQFENTVKTPTNKRKKIQKLGSRDVLLKEPLAVKNSANKNQTHFSDRSRSLNSKTQHTGRIRIKYTKLYELTEIPDRSSILTCCTPKTLLNMDEIYINPPEKTVDKLVLVNSYTVLNKENNVQFIGRENHLCTSKQPVVTSQSKFLMCIKYNTNRISSR